jgi:hypothetical protein
MDTRNYHTHVVVLAWINIACSAMFLFIGVFAFLLLTGIGFVSGDIEAIPVLSFIGTTAAMFFGAFSLPGLAAGYGLLKGHSWGRILAIFVGVLNLFNVPVGTAIGVYALWVLTHQHAAEYFDPTSAAAAPPVSPNPA